jgi:hypothetical protein
LSPAQERARRPHDGRDEAEGTALTRAIAKHVGSRMGVHAQVYTRTRSVTGINDENAWSLVVVALRPDGR